MKHKNIFYKLKNTFPKNMKKMRGGVEAYLGKFLSRYSSLFVSFVLLFASNIIFSSCIVGDSLSSENFGSDSDCDIYTQRCPRSGSWSSSSSGSRRRSSRSLGSSSPDTPSTPSVSLFPEVEEALEGSDNYIDESIDYICNEYENMFKQIRDDTDYSPLSDCIFFGEEEHRILCVQAEHFRDCLRARAVDDPTTSEDDGAEDEFIVVCMDEYNHNWDLKERLLHRQTNDMIRRLIYCVYTEDPNCLTPAQEDILERSQVIPTSGKFRNLVVRRYVDRYAGELECKNPPPAKANRRDEAYGKSNDYGACNGIDPIAEEDRLTGNQIDERVDQFEREFARTFLFHFLEGGTIKPYGEACAED